MITRSIYCCGCGCDVEARLTNGAEVYPRSHDLKTLPFWKCDKCKNFVGCHHKTQDRTRPLGVIPTDEIKKARMAIHRLLDPIWESGKVSRKKLYSELTRSLGRQYHTAEIKTIDEARDVYRHVQAIKSKIESGIYGNVI